MNGNQYDREGLRDLISKNIVLVRFTKSDGAERTMKCTLQPDFIPESKTKNASKQNESVLPVWDLDKSGWRCFRVDSVISVYF